MTTADFQCCSSELHAVLQTHGVLHFSNAACIYSVPLESERYHVSNVRGRYVYMDPCEISLKQTADPKSTILTWYVNNLYKKCWANRFQRILNEIDFNFQLYCLQIFQISRSPKRYFGLRLNTDKRSEPVEIYSNHQCPSFILITKLF